LRFREIQLPRAAVSVPQKRIEAWRALHAIIVVVDHLAQRFEATIVHVRRRERDVAQRRRTEESIAATRVAKDFGEAVVAGRKLQTLVVVSLAV
jgi:hypothetical protein